MINASKKYKSTVKKYHAKYIEGLQKKIRKLRTENPKDYWKLINSIDKKTDSIPISINDMFDYFKVLNKNNDPIYDNSDMRIPHVMLNEEQYENYNEIGISASALNNPINQHEISAAIKALKLNKSSGIDEIINEYIISTKHLMLPIYEKLFNIILNSGIVPSDWIKGNIIPIYKNKGTKTDPANYRPITLVSCIGKVFTSIINKRLSTYLEENKLLNETQSGFRKQYSTLDNIMVLYSLTEYFKSKNCKLYCCFVDFTKAFDNVWRAGLWRKVLSHGIKGKILNVIKNMYMEIKSCITLNGSTSEFFDCEKGVRQGENLSPLLFAIYMNDLENFLSTNGGSGINIDIDDATVTIFFKITSYIICR